MLHSQLSKTFLLKKKSIFFNYLIISYIYIIEKYCHSFVLYKVKDKLTPLVRLLQGEEVTRVGHQVESEVVRVDNASQPGGDGYRRDGVRVAPQQLNRDLELRQTVQPPWLKPQD